MNNLDKLSIDTLRMLSIDSVQNANHGHLGMPLGSAPMAYTLWSKFLNFNPHNTKWFNRDRFVLTSGHGSILLYSLLHIFGADISIDDLKGFRQLGSITPGHPEVGLTPGVEATTGPLGQGFAMTVGLAIAEKNLAAKFNRDDISLIDHYTYTICGDGDLMEGVANEAASLAGHLKLSKLIVLYDSNKVCSDGNVADSCSGNIQEKFRAMGWNTIYVENGNDIEAVANALSSAKMQSEKPSLIEVNNIIGYGVPGLEGTSKIHSNPISSKLVSQVIKKYSWKSDEKFYVPEDVKEQRKYYIKKGQDLENEWMSTLAKYNDKYPQMGKLFQDFLNNKFEINIEDLPHYNEGKMATRTASGESLNAIFKKHGNLIGGSADLASSNKTTLNNETFLGVNNDFSGPNIYFGVREFSMASIINGINLHGGLRGFSGTFLVFSDYMRSAIRNSAIMKTPSIYIFTHDSVAVGQDGPTHQPIEQLASLRCMPNLLVLRPADANETAYAWKIAVENTNSPTALILGRQDVTILKNTGYDNFSKGAYILSKSTKKADGIIVSSGSEVQLCLKAQYELEKEGIYVDIINMPSWELFEEQDNKYKNTIFNPKIKYRLAVEAGSSLGWAEYVGSKDNTICIDQYGESGDGNLLLEKLGFTVENIVNKYKTIYTK